MKSLFLILIFSGAVLGESPGFSKTGSDDFKVLAQSGKIVDKTLLIKDILDKNDLVTLITRPRRWGKSTSMNMLWRFFALEHDPIEAKQNKELFETLKIKNETVQDHVTGRRVNVVENFQGKCPSIFLSFKDVRAETLTELIIKLRTVISTEFRRHKYLADALEGKSHGSAHTPYDKKLAQSDLQNFERLSVDKGTAASKEDLESSLLFLSRLLHDYHNKTKVCVFFDEYDAPLHMAFTRGYLAEGAEIIRVLFGSVLKGNDALERGLLTGILRLAKADLFSGVNNLVEDNVFKSHYASHYGFTESELNELFNIFGVERKDEINFKASYNGYNFYKGQNISTKVAIYNPWSVIGYLKDNSHVLDNYWINTGGTELLDHLVVHPDVQDALATLRARQPIHIRIPKDVTFSGLTNSPETLWPLLVHTGYLTLKNPPIFHQKTDEYEVDLVIPNSEVQSAYNGFHNKWLNSNKLPDISSIEDFNNLITAIVAKDSEKVSEWIQHEKASGKPTDFTIEKWILNPLQLAALSGNAEIFRVVYDHYLTLHDTKDADGLTIGDYLKLSGLQDGSFPEPSIFKETVSSLESLCPIIKPPFYTISTAIVGGGSVCFLYILKIGAKTLKKTWTKQKMLKSTGALITIGTLVGFYKDLSAMLLKKAYEPYCGPYDQFHKVSPEKFSNLSQFNEYILRNSGSYVSLSACKNPISQFKKAVTNVKHAETQSLIFYLCPSLSNAEL